MNQIDLKGKHAIVTGGARGIGFVIAKRLLVSGARVSLRDRDGAALEAAAKVMAGHGGAYTAIVDLTNPDDVKSAVGGSIKVKGEAVLSPNPS